MINCEVLLDQCWAMLNRKYEEVYGVRNYTYNKPEFEFVLSAEQIRALRMYVVKTNTSAFSLVGANKPMLFGHSVIEQQRTPYLRARLEL